MINHRNRNLTNFNLVMCVSTVWNNKHIYTISGIYTICFLLQHYRFFLSFSVNTNNYICIVLSLLLLLLLLYEKNGMITALSLTVVVIGLIHVSRHSHENSYWIYVSLLILCYSKKFYVLFLYLVFFRHHQSIFLYWLFSHSPPLALAKLCCSFVYYSYFSNLFCLFFRLNSFMLIYFGCTYNNSKCQS